MYKKKSKRKLLYYCREPRQQLKPTFDYELLASLFRRIDALHYFTSRHHQSGFRAEVRNIQPSRTVSRMNVQKRIPSSSGYSSDQRITSSTNLLR
jgi:hypothetical protein